MVTASYEGIARICMGSKDGFKKPEFIRDANNKPVSGPLCWSATRDAFARNNRTAKGEKHPQLDIATSVAAVDWDEDGDQDLVLAGHEDGVFYLCHNIGTPTEPEFSPTNNLIQSDGKPLKLPSNSEANGIAGFRIADWDADGKFDLICGGIRGGVYLFRNVGESGSPKFATAKTLIARIEVDAFDEFLGRDVSPMKDGGPTMPTGGLHIEVVDYDRDGDLDILVGGNSKWFVKKLNPIKETDRKMFAEYKELEKEIMSLQDPEENTHYEKYLSLHEKLEELFLEDSESTRFANLVWLYRRK